MDRFNPLPALFILSIVVVLAATATFFLWYVWLHLRDVPERDRTEANAPKPKQ